MAGLMRVRNVVAVAAVAVVAAVTLPPEPTAGPPADSGPVAAASPSPSAAPAPRPAPDPVEAQPVLPGNVLVTAPPPPQPKPAAKRKTDRDRPKLRRDPKPALDPNLVDGAPWLDGSGTGVTSFGVASFNVLGASHTGKGSKRPKYAEGATRMRWAATLLRSAHVSVAGLQEFQPVQHQVFRRTMPAWEAWPANHGGRGPSVNAIVWDTRIWSLTQARLTPIPYFAGRPVGMPYVQLTHRGTGQRVWVANFHNPADARGPAQRHRDEAARRQVVLANALSADGTPVVFTGDFNDRAEYFCALAPRTTMHAANGGSVGGERCAPPPAMAVDWIFGSRNVTFSGYWANRSPLVQRTSDHPMIVARATIAPVA